MAQEHEKYILRVTAGPTYDTTMHEAVHVNSEKPVNISTEHLDARLHVRIKDYRGLPKGAPKTSPYFSTPLHTYDRYSISFSFTPKQTINGDHLVFGNDFENPIRDRLPPLFDKAFGIVKWWIDPGLDGDVYGDEPYLYGALLSSINVLKIGGKGGTKPAPDPKEEQEGETVVYDEGAEGDGQEVRAKHSIPAAPAQRQKYFLNEAKRKEFEFEAGREHKCDFFNPYLDFNEFKLKIGYGLPPISIMGHWDGQPLRYVLKNRNTNQELFVVIFQLIPTENAEKEGAATPQAKLDQAHGGKAEQSTGGDDDDLD